MKKIPSFKDVILSVNWSVSELRYDKEFQMYHFTATHESGRVIEMSKTANHVDKILGEIE